VHAGLEFLCKGRVNGAVAFDATHAGKFFRHDTDTEMGFTRAVELFMVPGRHMMMTGMKVALVYDDKALG